MPVSTRGNFFARKPCTSITAAPRPIAVLAPPVDVLIDSSISINTANIHLSYPPNDFHIVSYPLAFLPVCSCGKIFSHSSITLPGNKFHKHLGFGAYGHSSGLQAQGQHASSVVRTLAASLAGCHRSGCVQPYKTTIGFPAVASTWAAPVSTVRNNWHS